jgi:hypothetical protein
MLPIPNVIPKHLSQHRLAQVKCIKIHIISIDKPVSMVVYNNRTRFRAHRLPGHGIWKNTIQPGWISRHVVFGSQIYRASIKILSAVPEDVELFEI